MTISVAMMFGRMGALVGNVSFPFLLSMGCMPPFFLEGAIILRKLPNNCDICLHNFILFYYSVQFDVPCSAVNEKDCTAIMFYKE